LLGWKKKTVSEKQQKLKAKKSHVAERGLTWLKSWFFHGQRGYYDVAQWDAKKTT